MGSRVYFSEDYGNLFAGQEFVDPSRDITRPLPGFYGRPGQGNRSTMPSERLNPNPLSGIPRLLSSRETHHTLGVLAVLFALFCGFDATRSRPSDGTIWLLGRPTLEVLDTVSRVEGDPTPLRKGDTILGIGNTIVNSPQAAAAQLRRQQPGKPVPYLINRDGEQLQVMVPLTSTRVHLKDYFINISLALVYLVIGVWVYSRGTNDRATSLFYILCLLFTLYFMTNLNQVSYYLGAIIAQNIGAFARFMLPAVFLHFFLVFPSTKATLTRHPFLAPVIYLMPLMFFMRFTLDQFIGAEGAKIGATSWMVLGLYYVLGLGALLHGYFSYRDPLMRQRVRILTFGTLAAVAPFLVFKIGMEELGFHADLARFGVLPLAAIPVSFGYCVARYRVMQIDFLLKKSLSYALLTGLVWIGYLGGAWWLGNKVLGMLPDNSTIMSAGLTLAVAALLWPIRSRLQKNLDRGFYHSRDNMTALIEEFSKEIPRLIQKTQLLDRVGHRLCEVLQLPGMAIYLARGDEPEARFELSGSILGRPRLGVEGAHDGLHRANHAQGPGIYPELMELPALAPALARHGEPYWADAEEARQLEGRQAITREQALLKARFREQTLLVEKGIQLLIPMITHGRLVGLMALPRRRGDEDYQVHELQLLTIVAGQMALQVENARLYEEEVAKQKLEEEMSLARQIQSRLLPRTIPSFDGVQIQAVNISSTQVSGDYYDLIERQDGQLGMVIADVSGKGMPASILASNIQAAIRAQCDTSDSPGMMLERINRQIHASTDPQHFATLFLAIFDPIQRSLLYSSGGHNPPVVVRTDGTVELLEEGGLPLGAFDFGQYDEGRITLEDGDLVLFYTDGLTETKGPDGDEDFGEDRLNELLKERRDLDVDQIFQAIQQNLHSFSGRAEADDDITMIGLKISTANQAVVAESGAS
jgi:serine phosphatase RsbU (regulator of sigma subunit)